ncbi:hypothetical protein IMY05_009G0000300 [Salix suchowensis]|nr:hypothetical protein IMY05_009G0000300 [Salix suchowensis]
MARDYLFIYFARLSSFCVMGSFLTSLSTSYAGISTNHNINTSPKGTFCYCHVNFQIYYLSLSALCYLQLLVEQLTIHTSYDNTN